MSTKYEPRTSRPRNDSRGPRGPRGPRDRRRRPRSPSSDAYESGTESDSSYTSRESSPPRRSRRSRGSRAVHSDGEDRQYRRGRSSRRTRDYYDDVDVEYSPSPERRHPEWRGVVDEVLASLGIISAQHRGSSRRDRSSHGGDRGSLSDDDKRKARRQALQAALAAAATEAFLTRKEPGGLTSGKRLMRIATAALTSGGLDAIIDQNPNSHSMRHIVESVVAGLATGGTVGDQVKHRRPGNMRDKVGGGVIGMAARQFLSRSMSQSAGRRRRD